MSDGISDMDWDDKTYEERLLEQTQKENGQLKKEVVELKKEIELLKNTIELLKYIKK
jgi:cell division protein FtsB